LNFRSISAIYIAEIRIHGNTIQVDQNDFIAHILNLKNQEASENALLFYRMLQMFPNSGLNEQIEFLKDLSDTVFSMLQNPKETMEHKEKAIQLFNSRAKNKPYPCPST